MNIGSPMAGAFCDVPVDLNAATFPLSISGDYMDDPAVGGSCAMIPYNAIWFAYIAPSSGSYTFDLTNNTTTLAYSRFAAFETNSCSPLGTEVSCETATSASISSTIDLTAGTSYTFVFYTDGDVYTMINPEISITAP